MNILALDTSDRVLSAALEANSGRWYVETDSGIRHSELLMECIDWLCKTAGIIPGDIGLVACMKGPGSFTGLRIGFSSAKGVALALGIPMAAYPTLDCLAYPHSAYPGLVLPAIDAKKSCFYAALYRHGKRLTDDADASPEYLAGEIRRVRLQEGEPLLLTGCGAAQLRVVLAENFQIEAISLDPGASGGRARELLEIAKNSIVNGVNDIDSGPVYLRKSDAELHC